MTTDYCYVIIVVATIVAIATIRIEVIKLLMNDLSIIVRQSRLFFEKRMQHYEAGFPELIILMYLSKDDHVNQDTLAQHFMIDKGAIAKTTAKLEEKGYITRSQNPDNKRENIISMTDKGRNIIEHMGTLLEEWNNLIFDGLNKEEIQIFKKATDKITTNAADIFNKNWSNLNGKSE